MAGNRESGKQAAQTNIKRYGANYYKQLGKLGGVASTGRGFATIPGLASLAGRLGGSISRRGNQSKLTPDQKAKIRERFYKQYQKNLANLTKIHEKAKGEKQL
jgi:general stress protein YciG